MENHRFSRRMALVSGIGAAGWMLSGRARAFAQSLPDYPGNAQSPLLVSAAWLNAALQGSSPPVVLDLGELSDYRGGHVPGAVFSWWQETIERDNVTYGTLLNQRDDANVNANQAKRIAWLRRYGITNGDTVVAYDHGDGRRAARIAWFLRFLGITSAATLDGGYAAWQAAGYAGETTTRSARSLAADPTVSPQQGFYLVTSQLQTALQQPETVLVDMRSDDERHDSVDDQFPLGVIPGSVWAPWSDYVTSDGTYAAATDAAAKLTSLDITSDRRVVLYGRFGTDPGQMWVLLKLLNYPQVSTYDGGWIQWASTDGLSRDPLP